MSIQSCRIRVVLAIMGANVVTERHTLASISYSKLLDPVSDIISLMESLLAGAFGPTTGDQRECYKRIHAYSWGLHTLVMDVITALGLENAATRPAVLERFNALIHPTKATLDNLAAGFDGPLSEEQHETVGFVLESALSIEHMMGNLWQYSLLRHGKLTFADDEFDGALLIRRFRSILQDLTPPERRTTFCVIGDEACLTHAFGEIAYNIRRHADVDQVGIALQEYGYRADISIFDKGKGFRCNGDAAFEPFWQENAANPGLGLGLYLARTFIEGCGGALSISSQPNRGTLVKISLVTLP